MLAVIAVSIDRRKGKGLKPATVFQKTIAHGIVLHTPFGKQVSVSGEDYLCGAEACVSEL